MNVNVRMNHVSSQLTVSCVRALTLLGMDFIGIGICHILDGMAKTGAALRAQNTGVSQRMD